MDSRAGANEKGGGEWAIALECGAPPELSGAAFSVDGAATVSDSVFLQLMLRYRDKEGRLQNRGGRGSTPIATAFLSSWLSISSFAGELLLPDHEQDWFKHGYVFPSIGHQPALSD